MQKNKLSASQSVSLLAAMLRGGTSVAVQTLGLSMFPYIWPHDVVEVAPLSSPHGTPPPFGTVVVFLSQDNLICHRLVPADGAVQTRGDSNLSLDDSFASAELLGVVTRCRRWRFVRSESGFRARLWRKYLAACAPVSYRINHFLAQSVAALLRLKKRLSHA